MSDPAPDRAIYIVGIAEYGVDDLGSDIVDVVVRRDAPGTAGALEPFGGHLHGFHNSLRLDAPHDHVAFVHAFGTLVRFTDHHAVKTQNEPFPGHTAASA